ncbi:MAG: hydrogenase 4 subunit D [Armatimonadota bacterium]
MDAMVAAVVGVPILGGAVCLAVRDRASRYVAVLAAVIAAACACALAAAGTGAEKTVRLFGGMPWLGKQAARGIFGYEIDPLAIVMLLAATVIGVVIAVYSIGYLSEGNREHRVRSGQARYCFWLMVFVGSMAGIAVSPTLLQLLIFWEMTTLCSWALISFYDNEESLKAGMKALVMTSFGGLFFLGGLVWVFSATGSMKFDALGLMSPQARAWAFALFMIAAWAKSAQVPFHTWLPDAMAAPTPISAYLHAASMVKAGVFLVARLLLAGWHLPFATGLVLSIAALVTMFGALYLFFFQDDLKKLLAYSTIAQLGLILLGIGLGSFGAVMAARGAVLHILMHSCAKTLLFLTVGAISYTYGTRSMAKLSGLVRSMPLAAFSFFFGAFALTGIPPIACFWSKMYILVGALQVRSVLGPIALVLVLVESLISFGWFLWVGQQVFFGKPKREPGSRSRDENASTEQDSSAQGVVSGPPASMQWMLVAVILLTLAAPIAGIPIVRHIMP